MKLSETMTPAEVACTRKLLGLTASELAELIVARRSWVTEWELGRVPIREEHAGKIRALVEEHAAQVDAVGVVDGVAVVPVGAGALVLVNRRRSS